MSRPMPVRYTYSHKFHNELILRWLFIDFVECSYDYDDQLFQCWEAIQAMSLTTSAYP